MSGTTSRREALRLVTGAAGGLALAGSQLACAGGRAAPEAETRLPLARLSEGGRLRIDHHGEPVELQMLGGALTARSLVCTHQYCKMFWHPQSDGYRCPCHGAEFAPDGRPRSGPVSVPMWTLPVRVAGDEVVVGGAGRA